MKYYYYFPQGSPLSKIEKVPNLPKHNNQAQFQILAYCLMPNHFHLLIKQVEVNSKRAISNFMKRITITYVMYLKRKNERSGALFESKFKNVEVSNGEQLIYLSKYIHTNPQDIITDQNSLDSYLYSSYRSYTGSEPSKTWINENEILSYFYNDRSLYKKYVENNVHTASSTDKILIDND